MNGYFKIELEPTGNFLKIIPPTDGGTPVELKEILVYLNDNRINFDLKTLNDAYSKAEVH